MGKRGPQPTPTTILSLRGSWRAKTRPDNEPKAPGRPTCPRWLGDDEKLVWKQIVRPLVKMGLAGAIDGPVLSRYCVMAVQWRQCQADIREYGTSHEQHGQIVPYPFVGQAQHLHRDLLAIEKQFGMSPSARASLKIELPREKAKPDPKDRYFPE